jgi:sulfur carrier protein ThiS adenylyltransferase
MINFLKVDALRDSEFNRYSRQIMLGDWGVEGQLRLKNCHIAIVGCGGLGSVVASYLSGCGIGHLTLIDNDDVELSNLPRQLTFDIDSCGQNKSDELMQRLYSQNDEVDITIEPLFIDRDNINELLQGHDLILDCTDNFSTRLLINHWCINHNTPLVSGSVIGWQGQLLLVEPSANDGCYQCLFDTPNDSEQSCSTMGVNPAMVGVVGSYQANQALRFLLQLPTPLSSHIALIDGASMAVNLLTRHQNTDCTVCHNINEEAVT